MSFNDLERGLGAPALPLHRTGPSNNNNGGGEADDPEFKRLAERLGIQIFKISSNVAAIDKLVNLLGRGQGGDDLRGRMHDLTETTRELVKSSTSDIKSLASWQSTHPGTTLTHTQKLSQAKLQRDFEGVLFSFQRVQRSSAERQRSAVDRVRAGAARNQGKREGAKARANEAALEEPSSAGEPLLDLESGEARSPQAQQQQQQQLQAQGPSQAELEFQEALIAERESEIREIEGGIHELNEIFRDLGHIVQEQGGMIDNIEYNVTSIASNTGAASEELVSAHEYQRKAGRRAACLLLVVGFVVAIVLVAILN